MPADPSGAPAGTLVATLVEIRDHSSMQQGADGFYRSSVNVHALAARALRVFGAPAGSAPEPSLVFNALMVVSAEMHMAMGGIFDRKERDVRHAMQSLERAAALLEKRIALLRGAAPTASAATAPPQEAGMDAKFHESFDARDWAKAFVERVRANPRLATDEGTMLGWFANALMRGYDEHARRASAAAAEPSDEEVARAMYAAPFLRKQALEIVRQVRAAERRAGAASQRQEE